MYEQFYGLKEKPFSLTPDTEYFFRYRGHQEALNVLLVALRNGEGFIHVSGEVGTGKTLLCRQLLKLLQDDCAIAYLPNPLLTPLELYQAINHDLQLDLPEDASLQQLCQGIFAELVRLRKMKRPLVVLIDEAQAMPHRSLEALRLLSNLETEKEKLLHIFFFAQPEFEQRLAEENLRQLRQRITFSYTLTTLHAGELSAYLNHRLQVAGFEGESLFTSASVRLLHRASSGVPRVVNLLAHKAMLAGYGKGVRKIDRKLIVMAIKDTSGLSSTPGRTLKPYFREINMVMIVVIATLLVWGVLL
ncbi:AAA family ATPase [uncultured Desulfuromusa sp.]|uniref:ExeA family protein n=1 Tax=uncultured Desulfuromusa sp. TaxID=219183 RepID=UPI002AA865DD|nr:AAA family ATPase [uncultured Desulfuromusa sp.]